MLKPETADVLQCQICKHRWLPTLQTLARSRGRPERCVNQKCRSPFWDAEKYPTIPPPRQGQGRRTDLIEATTA